MCVAAHLNALILKSRANKNWSEMPVDSAPTNGSLQWKGGQYQEWHIPMHMYTRENK